MVWSSFADFLEVTKIVTIHAYLKPRTDIFLSLLGEAHYISALDLTKGYWQVPVCPKIRKRQPSQHPRGYTTLL